MSIAEFPSRSNNSNPVEFERTPPQDLVAEQSVLGGMLLSKDAIADVVEIIKERDFYRPAHELIYDAILDLYGKGEPADRGECWLLRKDCPRLRNHETFS